ncbi:MAG: hypothetical protein HYY03_03415 [Chloroflexi bacterium]|nr:hypothetical protein [Chloroflexota bacterium]
MRTLVIGIPLPNPSFDNYSFLSAPSFADYPSMIVEMAAVSQAVEEVAAGSAEHRTYAGQLVANGPSSARAFGLAEILAMRARETERFLARAGVIVAFAWPDVSHANIQGLPEWRRYSWLPSPQGFRYQEHILPGFGNQGVLLEDSSHPFSRYIEAFGPRLAYRAHVDEDATGFADYGRVFARSPGGAAAGVELALGDGSIILLPPLARFELERTELAQTLFECLERWQDRPPSPTPEWMRKEVS